MIRDYVREYLSGLQRCFRETSLDKLEWVAEVLLDAQQNGRQVFIIGNGGSAATASHMACDLGKGTAVVGVPRLRVISLADNLSILTAWANDESYECIFKEQLVNLLNPSDVLIAITASGNSPNILRAVEYANSVGATTIGLIGFGGGKLKSLVQIDITVSSCDYGQVEDFHLSLDHMLAHYLKTQLLLQTELRKPKANMASAVAD